MYGRAKWLYLSILGLALAVFGLVHQEFFTSTGWFNWQQLWHHEPLIAMALIAWFVLLIVYLVERKWKQKAGRRSDRRE